MTRLLLIALLPALLSLTGCYTRPTAPADERVEVDDFHLNTDRTKLTGKEGILEFNADVPEVKTKKGSRSIESTPASMWVIKRPEESVAYQKVYVHMKDDYYPDPYMLLIPVSFKNTGERTLKLNDFIIKVSENIINPVITTRLSQDKIDPYGPPGLLRSSVDQILLPGETRIYTLNLGEIPKLPLEKPITVQLIDVPVETNPAGEVTRRSNFTWTVTLSKTTSEQIVTHWISDDRTPVK